MNNRLYPKMAATNLKNNGRKFVPYMIACAALVMMEIIMLVLSRDPMLDSLSGGNEVKITLRFGCVILAIFSVIIVFYVNSLLIRQRKREFAIYNILGLEKKHIARILCWESLMTAVSSIIGGIVLGCVFSKLMQLILLKLISANKMFALNMSVSSIFLVTLFFLVLFFIVYLGNLRVVYVSQPVELLRAGSEGEKEPKTKAVLAIAGVITLGAGYVLSIFTKDSYSAILLFFIAVILVILGTYLMFIAFSIAILKMLRRKKAFYYRVNHFATISGMLYRMKRNAAGLASICILSTMVIITVSTTVCLYAGLTDSFNKMYPKDVSLTFYAEKMDLLDEKKAEENLDRIVQQCGLKHSAFKVENSLAFVALRNGSDFSLSKDEDKKKGKSAEIKFVTLAEYNRMTGRNLTMKDGEILYAAEKMKPTDRLTIQGRSYSARPLKSRYSQSETVNMGYEFIDFVVKDQKEMEEVYKLQKDFFCDGASSMATLINFDLTGDTEEKIACGQKIEDYWVSSCHKILEKENIGGGWLVTNKESNKKEIYSFYGAFLFIGVFLGAMFLMATVLIIYYKQISEGYDDKQRFEIMQKVGMTRNEVKKTIKSQVLMVFFLPLAAAAMHVIFAFPMMTKILAAMSMTNVHLFGVCTAATFCIFAIIYLLVYSFTAKGYYRIVSLR